jgi:hypothetical protein
LAIHVHSRPFTALCLCCAFAAFSAWAGTPFWESKPPAQWSDAELHELLTDSPWAQPAISAGSASGVQVYIASARPMRLAEEETERRAKEKAPVQDATAEDATAEDSTAGEYREFLTENEGQYIVLAVSGASAKALAEPAEVRRMEEQCILRVGGKKYKLTGHFPPSPNDPWLRLIFPRAVTEADRSFRFELYVPGAKDPLRFAEFRTKEMHYQGRLAL